MGDLEKYEAEVASLNKKLSELDEAKAQILRQGYRIEGIIAYLRAKKAEESKEAVPVAEAAL